MNSKNKLFVSQISFELRVLSNPSPSISLPPSPVLLHPLSLHHTIAIPYYLLSLFIVARSAYLLISPLFSFSPNVTYSFSLNLSLLPSSSRYPNISLPSSLPRFSPNSTPSFSPSSVFHIHFLSLLAIDLCYFSSSYPCSLHLIPAVLYCEHFSVNIVFRNFILEWRLLNFTI